MIQQIIPIPPLKGSFFLVYNICQKVYMADRFFIGSEFDLFFIKK